MLCTMNKYNDKVYQIINFAQTMLIILKLSTNCGDKYEKHYQFFGKTFKIDSNLYHYLQRHITLV